MISFLFILNSITGQVILTCSRQSDCYVGYYCDGTEMCYDCAYVVPDYCDSIDQNCCSPQFRRQCPTNPYQCPGPDPTNPTNPSGSLGPRKSEMNPALKTFLMIFSLVSVSYLLVGSYWNHRVNHRSGYDILPNRESWREFRSLVRDGVFFSYRFARHKLGYSSLE